MYSRHYRYNPLFTNPTVSDIKDPLRISFFDSITKARAFLVQVACLTPKQTNDPEMQLKIEAATKIVAKAGRRNDRRRARRAAGGSVSGSLRVIEGGKSRNVKTCPEAKQSVKDLCGNVVCHAVPKPQKTLAVGSDRVAWEEVLDPAGKVIRFKIIYHKEGPNIGTIKERRRVKKEEPKPGDIVLDLTSGIKAWRAGTREEVNVTKEMEADYKKSNLYRIRQLAAGYISLSQLIDMLNKDLEKTQAAKQTPKQATTQNEPSSPQILQGGKAPGRSRITRSSASSSGSQPGRRAGRRPDKPTKNRNRRSKDHRSGPR